MGRRKRGLKRVLATIVGIVVLAAVAFGGYCLYLEAHHTRIADNTSINNWGAGERGQELAVDETYSALTYNIGFGAYTPDYTFFMDEGEMKDGTKTVGAHSRAASESSVRAATEGSIQTMTQAIDGAAPDFILAQEVDTDSDRSYHVNQLDMIQAAFPDYAAYFASNFHSGFLAYPILEPHGRVNAGVATLSKIRATEVIRKSYPVSEEWPTKYFDLDRCFEVARYKVSNGHELVLINSHMSAYDQGGEFRVQQMKLLTQFIAQEYQRGNYVIAGGDWNHAISNSIELYPTDQNIPEWVTVFDEEDLPEGFSVVTSDNLAEVPSCRADDIPYVAGHTYTVTVDGFIVSQNVEATAHTIDTNFATSDHNPVSLTFKLKG